MKIRVGQKVLCRLAGSIELTEQVIAGFFSATEINGARVQPVLLESGRMILPSWILATVTA